VGLSGGGYAARDDRRYEKRLTQVRSARVREFEDRPGHATEAAIRGRVGGITSMRHTLPITRRPAQAQSAYASKLEFKQSASSLISLNTAFLLNNTGVLFTALFGNALGLFFTTIGSDTTT